MTQQIINVGTGPDSYTGESLRTAFQKVNENFSQLYAGNVGANISANILTANGFVTSGNLTAGNASVAGNISAYYFIGDGSRLTGVTATANTGDIAFSGQTISGTTTNANIVIQPSGTGGVNIPSTVRLANIRLGTAGDPELLITSNLQTNVARLSTATLSNGNISLQLQSSANQIGITLSPSGLMGFNTVPTAGYDFRFNGSVYGTEFYATENFPTGYQFNTPAGDTGLSHTYQNDSNGNVSLLRLRHDNAVPARFYENNTTLLSGNLVVSQNGNVFGTFPNAFAQIYSSVNSYSQLVLQNTNNGSLSSSDIVVTADTGNDSVYFGDFGIGSSAYNYPGYGIIKPKDVYLLAVGNNITGPGSIDSGNLILGTTTGNIKMFVGAPEEANVVATFKSTSTTLNGNLVTSGSYVPSTAASAGTAGQIAWDGNYVYVCVATNTWKRANLSTW